MPQHPDKPVVETTTDARAGETGHNVRHVLIFGLGGVIVAFSALLCFFRKLMDTTPDKRTIEIKAQSKGMFLSPWMNNDPTMPEKTTYWLVDEVTDSRSSVSGVPNSGLSWHAPCTAPPCGQIGTMKNYRKRF